MKLYVAYFNPQRCEEIKLKTIEADCDNHWYYTWNQEQFPEIYPKYNGTNFGKEERAYHQKSLHYVIHSNKNELEKKIQRIINRHIDDYRGKLRRWENMKIANEEISVDEFIERVSSDYEDAKQRNFDSIVIAIDSDRGTTYYINDTPEGFQCDLWDYCFEDLEDIAEQLYNEVHGNVTDVRIE